MKRIGKLRRNYHDAKLRIVRFEEHRVEFEIDVNAAWNNRVPESATLAFESVQNIGQIRAELNCPEPTSAANIDDEIIGIGMLSSTRYLIDLQAHGGLEIECGGISEV